jgi:hypothetical protein
VAEESVHDLVGREVRFVELVLSPPPDRERVAAAGIPPEAVRVQGDAMVLQAGSIDEANRWIDAVRGIGGRLCSAVPVKRHLEDVYVEQVAGGRPAGGGRE